METKEQLKAKFAAHIDELYDLYKDVYPCDLMIELQSALDDGDLASVAVLALMANTTDQE